VAIQVLPPELAWEIGRIGFRRDPVRLHQFETSDELEIVVMPCLATRPGERYQRAEDYSAVAGGIGHASFSGRQSI
jgi:hypothetical protein